ncbi:hypothetical protein RF11_02957 [Thelohanellus kitauei]|uniref:Uncharacterized protein n=1 Tax=Thelohanellus kitauei TaxID=669202 RepID=A0A0C2MVP5_THEKT|nr:hypothetical protein RF11_02957 [Thelohanellus kitauei]
MNIIPEKCMVNYDAIIRLACHKTVYPLKNGSTSLRTHIFCGFRHSPRNICHSQNYQIGIVAMYQMGSVNETVTWGIRTIPNEFHDFVFTFTGNLIKKLILEHPNSRLGTSATYNHS